MSLIPKKFISVKTVNCKGFNREEDCTPRGGTHEDQCKWVNPGYDNHMDTTKPNCQPKIDSERVSYRRSLEQEIVTLQSITIFLLSLSLIVIGISMGIAAKKAIEKMKKVTKKNKLTSLETKLLYPFLLIVWFVFAVLTRGACCRVGEEGEEKEVVEGKEQKEEEGIEMGNVANSSLELTQKVDNPMNATGQSNKTFTVGGTLGVQTAPVNMDDIKGALQLMYQTCAPNKLNKPGFVDNIVAHYIKKHGDNAWKQLCVTYQEVYHYDLEKYRADAAAQTAAQAAAQAAATKTTVETKTTTTTTTMAPPWREVLDPKSGRMYYYNSETNKTTWKRPK